MSRLIRLLAAVCILLLPVAHARAVVITFPSKPAASLPALPLAVNIPAGEYSTALHSGGRQAANRAASNFLDRITADGWTPEPQPRLQASVPAARVPEPASLALMGIGLIGLAATSRRRRPRVNRRC